MASISERLSENATGRFYVTANCIACGLCYSEAPAFFRLHEENGFALVYRQPITAAELALAEEAVQSCPVEAIGDDGD